MKTITLVVGLVPLLAGIAAAQVFPPTDASSNLPPREDLSVGEVAVPPETLDAWMRFQTDTVYKLVGVNFTVNGAIPQAVRSRNPWQMINPFAPPEYGSGLHNVSVNPMTGRAEGIRLIGLGF